jgi:hypothetical protein
VYNLRGTEVPGLDKSPLILTPPSIHPQRSQVKHICTRCYSALWHIPHLVLFFLSPLGVHSFLIETCGYSLVAVQWKLHFLHFCPLSTFIDLQLEWNVYTRPANTGLRQIPWVRLVLTPKVLWWFQAKIASKHPFWKQAIHSIFLNSFFESNRMIF